MTQVKTTVELHAQTPWYVTLSARTSLPVALFIGAWGLVWAFGGVGSYLSPRFSSGFVTFLSLGWVPVALANFILLHFVGRFHMRLMDEAASALHDHTRDVIARMEDEMRERHDLPPIERQTIQ